MSTGGDIWYKPGSEHSQTCALMLQNVECIFSGIPGDIPACETHAGEGVIYREKAGFLVYFHIKH